MITIFWDAKGILLIDYPERGATLISILRDCIKERRKVKLSRGILFHQEYASVHKRLVSLKVIQDAGFELLIPYSPDLASSDFYLFSYLKKRLRGTKFESDDAVMATVQEFF